MPTYEEWPSEETTVVQPHPPVEPAPPFSSAPGGPLPPPGRGPDDGIGWGFLIGILIALVVGGIVAAILLTRHHNRTTTTTVTTVPATTTASAPTTTVRVTSPTTPTAATTTPTTSPTKSTTQPAAPTTASVPDVGSSRVQGAVQKLNSAGLLVTLAYVPSELPLGAVVAESPSAGSSAPAGSHVTLNLSRGKDGTSSNTVPSVTGRSIPEAVAAVKSAGLRLIFVRKPVADKTRAGTIVAQTPAPGMRIPAHGEVLVYMGAVR